jgi:hypothetical protein
MKWSLTGEDDRHDGDQVQQRGDSSETAWESGLTGKINTYTYAV